MSAVPVKTADPSMEEILASIRRIIADDDEKAPEDRNAADAATDSDHPSSGLVTGPSSLAETGEEGSDLRDLAEVHDQPETSPEIDVPDFTLKAPPEQERGHAAELPDVSAPLGFGAGSGPSEAAAPAPPSAVIAESSAPVPGNPAPPPPEVILAREASASVGKAFNLLSHTVMSQNQHTVEDVVRELLKPMLKAWLDDNLPPLVERLVAAEIQRLARGQR